ncbi:ribosome recycling factor [Neolewinella lacunae]|uniref:Ribosome-recycling factor n=1 Tax=Neolewinella lacunae TaxID=1517758 RepID=A0A923PT20_9BACT|nr:ribosome recycling factor [Neolewinella lacunae]MBC6996277.1 ribosome recycling factor [Neolewinella lacunae]MDN3636900.1 ribosome recycling factor [Neolewinella lacunae]
MEELLSDKLEEAKILMEGAIEHLERELLKVRTGKASPAMLNGLMVTYYGAPTPLQQVANIATADSRTLTIQPFDKNAIGGIEKAIFEANLGVTPQNDGQLIRINIPPLTEERRQQMAKQVKAEGEDAKITVRNIRRDAMEAIKKEVKNGYPEDEGKTREEEVQSWVNGFNKKIDEVVENKTREVTTL